MSIQQFINKELIFTKLNFNSQRELFHYLYDKAKQGGFVTDDFLSRLTEREKIFPTGLKLGKNNVAIPHTDAECVTKEFIAIATLNTPVLFRLMDNNAEQADVSLVFMLGLNNPHNQLEVLQELVGMIQDGAKVNQLVQSSSREEMYQALNGAALRK
ncbi:PTS sugar transporter subunit IIA [Sporolactobacillus shoreicorticis]|uniref:PTS sugar transporter subunit IIA n=1 Tax=Sporolactobacillus shoreicorticis TaxID=1923877 RepID=A0ABW5S407_9BACL|nr:PTS sugar transporter subunit IIA [Sporolactobacillus shoreicorticis]MCO7128315.1 PTS sugar transporter subunit IIA [Sporolactobacillus shoreicorticis]